MKNLMNTVDQGSPIETPNKCSNTSTLVDLSPRRLNKRRRVEIVRFNGLVIDPPRKSAAKENIHRNKNNLTTKPLEVACLESNQNHLKVKNQIENEDNEAIELFRQECLSIGKNEYLDDSIPEGERDHMSFSDIVYDVFDMKTKNKSSKPVTKRRKSTKKADSTNSSRKNGQKRNKTIANPTPKKCKKGIISNTIRNPGSLMLKVGSFEAPFLNHKDMFSSSVDHQVRIIKNEATKKPLPNKSVYKLFDSVWEELSLPRDKAHDEDADIASPDQPEHVKPREVSSDADMKLGGTEMGLMHVKHEGGYFTIGMDDNSDARLPFVSLKHPSTSSTSERCEVKSKSQCKPHVDDEIRSAHDFTNVRNETTGTDDIYEEKSDNPNDFIDTLRPDAMVDPPLDSVESSEISDHVSVPIPVFEKHPVETCPVGQENLPVEESTVHVQEHIAESDMHLSSHLSPSKTLNVGAADLKGEGVNRKNVVKREGGYQDYIAVETNMKTDGEHIGLNIEANKEQFAPDLRIDENHIDETIFLPTDADENASDVFHEEETRVSPGTNIDDTSLSPIYLGKAAHIVPSNDECLPNFEDIFSQSDVITSLPSDALVPEVQSKPKQKPKIRIANSTKNADLSTFAYIPDDVKPKEKKVRRPKAKALPKTTVNIAEGYHCVYCQYLHSIQARCTAIAKHCKPALLLYVTTFKPDELHLLKTKYFVKKKRRYRRKVRPPPPSGRSHNSGPVGDADDEESDGNADRVERQQPPYNLVSGPLKNVSLSDLWVQKLSLLRYLCSYYKLSADGCREVLISRLHWYILHLNARTPTAKAFYLRYKTLPVRPASSARGNWVSRVAKCKENSL